jgi:transcriptional regulator with XRE-family HTH domain
MENSFSRYFLDIIEYKQLTRKDVLRLFHLSGYDDISHVDSITLSRWLNGKTTPNLYKQLIIVSCLGGSVLDFISLWLENLSLGFLLQLK